MTAHPVILEALAKELQAELLRQGEQPRWRIGANAGGAVVRLLASLRQRWQRRTGSAGARKPPPDQCAHPAPGPDDALEVRERELQGTSR